MSGADFPAFFTVRNMIMLIDGSLNNPFFIRGQDKSVKMGDVYTSWHNENKGVMMINNYFKKDQNNEKPGKAEPNISKEFEDLLDHEEE
jgi:hypothetical protein